MSKEPEVPEGCHLFPAMNYVTGKMDMWEVWLPGGKLPYLAMTKARAINTWTAIVKSYQKGDGWW